MPPISPDVDPSRVTYISPFFPPSSPPSILIRLFHLNSLHTSLFSICASPVSPPPATPPQPAHIIFFTPLFLPFVPPCFNFPRKHPCHPPSSTYQYASNPSGFLRLQSLYFPCLLPSPLSLSSAHKVRTMRKRCSNNAFVFEMGFVNASMVNPSKMHLQVIECTSISGFLTLDIFAHSLWPSVQMQTFDQSDTDTLT